MLLANRWDDYRKQSGKYTITATNESGTDSVSFEIKVKGRPSKPKGPLGVKDVFEDRATLDWKPPEDDGGEPIEHVSLSQKKNAGLAHIRSSILITAIYSSFFPVCFTTQSVLIVFSVFSLQLCFFFRCQDNFTSRLAIKDGF